MFNKEFYKFDAFEKKWLLPTILAGFIIRLLYVLEVHNTPFYQSMFSDSNIYYEWAKNIALNNEWIGNEPFFMAPLYPYFMALVFKIFGPVLFVVKLLQVVASTFTILIVYRTAEKLFNKEVAIVSAFISAFYVVFVFYSAAILSETFQVFFYVLFIYELLRERKIEDKYSWLKLGIYFGILVLFRANILLFVPVFIIYLYRKYRYPNTKFVKIFIPLGIFAGGVLLPMLPLTVHNYFASGEFIPVTSNGGINFYIGNNERSPGVYINPEGFTIANDPAGRDFAQSKTGRRMDYSDASSYWYSKSLDYIAHRPAEFFGLLLKKTVLFFHGSEFPQSTVMDYKYFEKNYSDVLKLPLFGYWFVSLLGLFGIIMYAKSKSDKLILYFFFSYLFATILFFVNGRFRLAITPLLIIFTAYAIHQLFVMVKTGNFGEFRIPGVVTGLMIIILTFVVNVPTFGEYDAYLHLGDIAYEKMEFDKAIDNYNRATFFKETSTAYMNMGNALARKKDFRNAIGVYAKAINHDPDNGLIYFNMGFAYTQMGQTDKAYESYKKALELDPTNSDAIRNIGILFYVQESYEDALFYFNRYLELSNDEKIKTLVRKDIENINLKLGKEK